MQTHDILLGQDDNGGYIRFGGTEHIAVYARTGTGKTSSITIPNCFAWKGSLVILDIKGEAFKATAGHRAAMGQDVYRFDPMSRDGRSHRWDPFSSVDRTSINRFDQIARQAFMLFPEEQSSSQNSSNASQFWTPAARDAFTSVATLLAETPGEDLSMASVLRVFARGDGDAWLLRQINARRHGGNPYSELVVDGISDYLKGDIPQVEGIRKSVSTRITSWRNPVVSAATSGSDFDLRDLRKRPMTIYLTVAPGNMARLRPLLRLFFNQLITLNSETTPQDDPSLKVPVLVLLDEFIRLGVMLDLAEAAQFVRGYGLRLAFLVQNKAQLRAKYGDDAATDIFDNLGAEIEFGSADPKVTQDLEKRLGDNTVMFTTRSKPRFWAGLNWNKHNESDHPHRRPLMLDQEVAQMNPAEQIIIRPGMRPMKTKRIRWFDDPHFTTLVRSAPVIPKLDIQVAYDDGTTRVLRDKPRAMSGLTTNDFVTTEGS